jgi:hypothetical protein
MKITLDIPVDRIANMMVSAIESGDPVTCARKGGWCWGIYYRTRFTDPPETKGVIWYAMPEFYDLGTFQIEIIEVADESAFQWFYDDESPCEAMFGGGADWDVTTAKNLASGALKSHIIERNHLIAGLAVMAEKFSHQFGQILCDDTDAPCADAFLQAVVFGEEKYA